MGSVGWISPGSREKRTGICQAPARNRSGNGNKLGTNNPPVLWNPAPGVSWSTTLKWARGRSSRKMRKSLTLFGLSVRRGSGRGFLVGWVVTLSGYKECFPARTSWDNQSNLPRDVVKSHHWSLQDVTGQGATESHPGNLPDEIRTG